MSFQVRQILGSPNSLHELSDQLASKIESVCNEPDARSPRFPLELLASVRELAVLSAELEQRFRGTVPESLSRVSILCARSLYRVWMVKNDWKTDLLKAGFLLKRLRKLPNLELAGPFKRFSSSLQPESFFEPAQAWLSRNPANGNREVKIFGIRSLGPSCATAVAAALEQGGWKVSRSPRSKGLSSKPFRLALMVADEGAFFRRSTKRIHFLAPDVP